MKSYLVYLHRRATDGKVFYVGKGDIKRANRTTTRSDYWNRIVAKYGFFVEIHLDGIQEWYAFELEKELIAYYGRENLCNMTDGGEGVSGSTPSDETRAKLSKSLTGKKKSEDHRIKLSEARKGRKLSEEHKRKIGDAHKGRKFSEESKKKMSDSTKGIKKTIGQVEKMRVAKSKVVLCSNGIKFIGVSEAAKWLRENGFSKACKSGVSSSCIGEIKIAYGYTWKYVDGK